VLHLSPAGPVTRVQLQAVDFGVTVQVDVGHERREELRLRQGETVYVSPRQVRVFATDADYSI
jgi:sulfate transport system ATP-binding protein